jgi:hypothetical protein
MTVIDIATATIPGMILLLAVGIGGDALSKVVRGVATSRFDLDRLTKGVGAARDAYSDQARRLDEKNRDLAKVESQYLDVARELHSLRAAESALKDPHNNTVFEIGRPLAGSSGWYAKLLLHRNHDMFNGLGTAPTNAEGYRTARLVFWGINGDTARQLCRQRFSKDASVLSIQAFRGKLKRSDV